MCACPSTDMQPQDLAFIEPAISGNQPDDPPALFYKILIERSGKSRTIRRMAKRRLTLSERQEKELQRAFRKMQDGATRIRYQAVRLYGQGYPVPEICQITGCNRTSLLELFWDRAP